MVFHQHQQAAMEKVLCRSTVFSPVGSSGFTGRKRSRCAIASASLRGITTTGKQGKIFFRKRAGSVVRLRFQAMNRRSSRKQSRGWPRACLSPSRCTDRGLPGQLVRSIWRKLLNDLHNGEGEGRKYMRSMMIDDDRPSLLPAFRPSVRPATGETCMRDPNSLACAS